MTHMIPISSIDAGGIDSYLQGESHAARVASLVRALTKGVEVPPITVFAVFEKRFSADGRHRLRAHQVLGRTEIAADLIHVRSLHEFQIEKALFLLRQRQEYQNRLLFHGRRPVESYPRAEDD